MRWITSVLLFLSFLQSAAAQRKFLAPLAGAALTTGEKYTIRWETITGRGYTYISLWTNDGPGKQAAEIKPLRTMGVPVEDPGSFDWTPKDTDLFLGISEYFILVKYAAGGTNNDFPSGNNDLGSEPFTLKQAGSSGGGTVEGSGGGSGSLQTSSKKDTPGPAPNPTPNTPSTLSSSTRGAANTPAGETKSSDGAGGSTDSQTPQNTQGATTGDQDPSSSSDSSSSSASGSTIDNPSSPSSTNPPSDSGSSGVPIAALVGGILGGVIVILLFGIFIFLGRKRNWFGSGKKTHDAPIPPPLPPVIAELGKGDEPNYIVEQPIQPPAHHIPGGGVNETAQQYYAELPAVDPEVRAYAELPGYAPLETAAVAYLGHGGIQETTTGRVAQETMYNGATTQTVQETTYNGANTQAVQETTYHGAGIAAGQETAAWGHDGARIAENIAGRAPGERRNQTETVAGTLADARR